MSILTLIILVNTSWPVTATLNLCSFILCSGVSTAPPQIQEQRDYITSLMISKVIGILKPTAVTWDLYQICGFLLTKMSLWGLHCA